MRAGFAGRLDLRHMLNKVGKGRRLAIVSIAVAALCVLPSAAPFTPAVFLSLAMLFVAALAAVFGSPRLSLVTLAIVIITVMLSPISDVHALQERPGIGWAIMVPFVVYFVALAVGLKGRRHSADL